MTDAEIIKDCKNCLHYDICLQWSTEPLNNADWCIHFIDENIINRLKAENERLKGIINKDVLLVRPRSGKTEIVRQTTLLRAKEIKSEAVKEFAERLITERLAVIRLKGKSNDFAEGFQAAIDYVEEKCNNLLKEMGCE